MQSSIESRGLSDDAGSWNTKPKCDRSGRSAESLRREISVPDTVTVPEGYAWAAINRWGDKLHANSPAFRADAGNTGDDQALQVGYNHDGMHFFPIDSTNSTSGSSDEGLMVTNHEYITPHYFFPLGVEPGNARWTLDWVRKSQHAQGVSVVHMRRNGSN